MIINLKLNLKDYENSKKELLNLINSSRPFNENGNKVKRNKNLDKYFSDTPSLLFNYIESCAYKSLSYRYCKYNGYSRYYCKFLNPENNKLDSKLEKIIAKNTIYALNYFRITGQKCFTDKELNNKFFNRVYSHPDYSFYYAFRVLKKRIPKDKESVFLKNYKALYHYAKLVVKGPLDKEINKKLTLFTFSQEYKVAKEQPNRSYGGAIYFYNFSNIDYLREYMENQDKLSVYEKDKFDRYYIFGFDRTEY